MRVIADNILNVEAFKQVGTSVTISSVVDGLSFNSIGADTSFQNYWFLEGYNFALKNIIAEIEYKKTSTSNSKLLFGFKSQNVNAEISVGLNIVNIGDVTHIYFKQIGILTSDVLLAVIPLSLNSKIKVGFEIEEDILYPYVLVNNVKTYYTSQSGTYNTSNLAFSASNGSHTVCSYKVATNYTSNYDFKFHGDSITANGGSYAYRLKNYFDVAINAGQGDKSAELVRSASVSNSINCDYDIILIGTNDQGFGVSLATFEGNLRTLKATLIKNKKSQPYICEILPKNSASVVAWNQIIYKVFSKDYIIPTYRVLLNEATGGILATKSNDGLHPNASGNKDLADFLVNYIYSVIYKI